MNRPALWKHFIIFVFAFTMLNALSVFAGPSRTTYQAKIIKPDGYPLEATSVNFKFTILDPAGSCILYSETFSTVNMGSSAGLVSFSLGTGVRTFPVVGSTFEQVFSNTTASLTCDAGGPATYSPSANDTRKIVMQFNDGNGWQTLPAMTINAVPYAMYANDSLKFGGKDLTEFVQVASLPTCGASEAMRFNGVGFSCIAAGGSGTITSGSVITALGYTPGDGASITAVTSDLNAVSSTVASVSSTVYSVSSSVASLQNSVAVSFAALTSSQWSASGTSIFYNTGNVGVGTSQPDGAFNIARTGAPGTFVFIDTYSGTSGINPAIVGRSSRGVAGTASATLQGDKLLFIGGRGDTGAGFSSASPANIILRASENWSAASHGTQIEFSTSANGTNIALERMKITNSGNVGIGTTTPVTKLDVSGAIRISMETATCAASYAGAIRYNAGTIEFCDGTTWTSTNAGAVTSAAITSALGYTPSASGVAGFLVADGGSTASPTVRFAPDASTGFYRFGTNSIGVSVNNNFLARFDSAGLQVQGNISAGNQCSYKICIGMWSAPGNPTPALTDLGQVIGINRNGPGTTVLGNGLYVTAGGAPTGSSNIVGGDLILGSGVATGNATSNIELRTASAGASGTADSVPTVKMKILGNGNVGIGTTTPSNKLTVAGTANFTSNVGIGTTTPNGPLHIYGSGRPRIESSGDTAYLDLFGGFGNPSARNYALSVNAAALGNFDILQSPSSGVDPSVAVLSINTSGNVGIGTSAPSAKLDVSGTVKISGGSPASGKVLTSDASGNATWQAVTGDNLGNHTATQNINLGTYKLVGQGGSEGITIDSSGNIRLGSIGGTTQITAGPGSTASGSSWASIAAGFNAQASSITSFAFGSYANATNWYAFATGNNTTAGGRASAVFGQNITVNSDYSVGFGLSSSVSYTVNTPSTMAIMGGNVGIGTTTPSYRLSVYEGSSSVVQNIESGNNGSAAYLRNTGKTAGGVTRTYGMGLNISDGTGGYEVYDFTAGASRMFINSSGDVGIGTTTPSVMLTVDDSGGTVSSPYAASTDKLVVMSSGNGVIQVTTPVSNTGAIYFSDPQSRDPGGVAYSHLTDSMSFRVNQATRMTITSGGAVGIGTGSPSYAFDVNGQGRFQTSYAQVFQVVGLGTGYADSTSGVATIYSQNTAGSGGNVLKVGSAFAPNGLIVKDNGNIGIGTTNPGAKLDVAGDGYALFGPNSGWGATLRVGGNGATVTAEASIATTNGNLHLDALDNSHNTYMNWYRGGDFLVGKGDSLTSLFVVKNSGNVGIGTAGPTALLHVNGAALATAWNTSSDRRLKENIKPIENPVDKILQLRGVEFDWRKDVAAPTKYDEAHDIGVIAQEVEKVFPEAVTTPKTGYKAVAYSKLVAPLIEAVKSLYHRMLGLEAKQVEQVRAIASKADQQALDMANAKIQKLESENAAKDKEIQDMKLRLEKIEKALNSK